MLRRSAKVFAMTADDNRHPPGSASEYDVDRARMSCRLVYATVVASKAGDHNIRVLLVAAWFSRQKIQKRLEKRRSTCEHGWCIRFPTPTPAWPGAILLLAYLAASMPHPCGSPTTNRYQQPTRSVSPKRSTTLPLGQSIAFVAPGPSVLPSPRAFTCTFHIPAFVVGLPDRSFLFLYILIDSRDTLQRFLSFYSKDRIYRSCVFLRSPRRLRVHCYSNPADNTARLRLALRLSTPTTSNTNLWPRYSTRKLPVRRTSIFATRFPSSLALPPDSISPHAPVISTAFRHRPRPARLAVRRCSSSRFAAMLRPATPLAILLAGAFVLLLISVISAPIVKSIYLGEANDVVFGVFGYCPDKGDCSSVGLGYDNGMNPCSTARQAGA